LEEFLATAKVIGVKKVPIGITQPRKLILEKDGIRMHAIFRHVDTFQRKWHSPDGKVKIDFHDFYMYELAAYRLGKLLGFDNIPPAVYRKFKARDFSSRKLMGKMTSKTGTVQAWVEQAITERERQSQHLRPPNTLVWMMQMQQMQLFDNLIFNDDRNQGNVLIDADWKVWLVDATRAFRPYGSLSDPEKLRKIDSETWNRLRALRKEDFKLQLDGVLSGRLINCLAKRHQKLLVYIEAMIDERGEHVVVVSPKLAKSLNRAQETQQLRANENTTRAEENSKPGG
jgi:hypothetical protein